MGKTPNLKALTEQLAEMQATLGRLAEPAAGLETPPAAGEVTLYDFWSSHMDGLKSDGVNGQYKSAICHLQNRLRKCDECGFIICPLKRTGRSQKAYLMRDRKCVVCSSGTTSTAKAAELTVNLLTAWVSQSITDGYSAETCRRWLAQIRAVLNEMADAGISGIRPPRRITGLPRSASNIRLVDPAEIKAVYQSCDVSKVWPAAFWRVLICGLTLYGFRVGEITSLVWRGRQIGAVREGITFGKKAPTTQLRVANITHPHGWLVYLPKKQAAIKPDPLVHPLSSVWRKHLLTARGFRNQTGQVLPVSNESGNFKLREPEFRAEFKRIQNAAGIKAKWTFKSLRATCETFFGDQFTPGDAQALTGHADRSVSGRSYNETVKRLCGMVEDFQLNKLFEA